MSDEKYWVSGRVSSDKQMLMTAVILIIAFFPVSLLVLLIMYFNR